MALQPSNKRGKWCLRERNRFHHPPIPWRCCQAVHMCDKNGAVRVAKQHPPELEQRRRDDRIAHIAAFRQLGWSYCGWTKSCTTLKVLETIVCWYLQGNHHSRVSQVVQDFVHPQFKFYQPPPGEFAQNQLISGPSQTSACCFAQLQECAATTPCRM